MDTTLSEKTLLIKYSPNKKYGQPNMITLGPFKPTVVLTLKLFMNTQFDCWGYQDFKNI